LYISYLSSLALRSMTAPMAIRKSVARVQDVSKTMH
jgi:hypothetical protein